MTIVKRHLAEKVYKLSLNGGMTCPNRDGSLSYTGCFYCSEGGSGDFASDSSLPIAAQLTEARRRLSSKTDCRKFIAYFRLLQIPMLQWNI